MTVLFSIEGTIGAGKSTVFNALRADLQFEHVAFVEEPVAIWEESGLLQSYYKGELKSISFQLIVLATRFKLFNDAFKKPGVKVIVSERSMEADFEVFAKLLLEGIDLAAYEVAFNALSVCLPDFLHKVVYLETSPQLAVQRIQSRGRNSENEISKQFLTCLDNRNTLWLQTLAEAPIYIDASENEMNVIQEVKSVILNAMKIQAN